LEVGRLVTIHITSSLLTLPVTEF